MNLTHFVDGMSEASGLYRQNSRTSSSHAPLKRSSQRSHPREKFLCLNTVLVSWLQITLFQTRRHFIKYQFLNSKAQTMATRYKTCETALLQIIIEVDKKKAYLHWGHNPLFAYVSKGLGLSPGVTSNFVTVARKSHEVPALKENIIQGKMSVCQARKITPVLNRENQKTWLDKAQNLTQKNLEKEVAMANPKSAVAEKTKYVAPNKEITESVKILNDIPRIQLQVGLSEKTMICLRRAQYLESRRTKGVASLEDTLEALLEIYLKKYDSIEKAKRQKIRGKLTQSTSYEEEVPVQEKRTSDRSDQVEEPNRKPSEKHRTRSRSNNDFSKEEKSTPNRKKKTNSVKEDKPMTQMLMSQTYRNKSQPQHRKAIPAKVRHQVQIRDGSRCTQLVIVGEYNSSSNASLCGFCIARGNEIQ